MRPCILIIDMQEKVLKHLDEADRLRIVSSQRRLLGHACSRGIHRILVEYDELGPTDRRITRYFREDGLCQTFPKDSEDCFSNPALEAMLRHWGITDLILSGCYLSSCVIYSAAGAKINGHSRLWTSHDLLADLPKWKNCGRDEWYPRNTRYFSDVDSLVASLEQKLYQKPL